MVEAVRRVPAALPAFVQTGRHGRQDGAAGVLVTERGTAGLATLSERPGQRDALAKAVMTAYGIGLPAVGKRVAGPRLALVATGPGQWLAEAPACPAEGMETALRSIVGAAASVVDQSHARVLLRLSGPHVRDALAAGVPIDLHPRAFAVGDAAQTIVSHIGVLIWQIAADPVYEIAVPRSFVGSFWHWFEAAAGRYGLDVRSDPC